MTHRGNQRSIRLDALARVEGEGALRVEISDGRVDAVQLRIYEPPRFFEALLVGRSHLEAPDITARICGICPVAYQMSACAAIEDACGVTVPEPIRRLRLLLYCGEWIESHALHIHLLHAPDFLGYESGIAMAGDHRHAVERGLALKKTGNELVELIGGRAIHPINVRVGGFHRAPGRAELRAVAADLARAREQAAETLAWVGGFDFPDLEVRHELVALEHADEYPILGDRLVSSGGRAFPVRAFEEQIVESQVGHSTALHAHLTGGDAYLVGPLARYGLAFDRLSDDVRSLARAAGFAPPLANPFLAIGARAAEVLHACELALTIVEGYEPPERPHVEVEPRAGVGYGASEAPRGTLLHRYTLDDDGTILDARIVPPTSQNQAVIERDLRDVAAAGIDLDDEDLRLRCEAAIRNHDPCISCATHFLDLEVVRR